MNESSTGADGEPTTLSFTLQPEHELRFEIPTDAASATLTLKSGSAEVFGIELALNRSYQLQPALNAAAFTWHGATLQLCAPRSVMAYTATDTPMPTFISAHAVLQSKRRLALAAGLPGPRALVVGPRDCGKTALVNTLAAYCVKENGAALVADLDPSGTGAAGVVPGALAASVVSHLDLDAGGLVHEQVTSLLLGHVAPSQNVAVSSHMFATMGSVLDDLVASHDAVRGLGCLVDSCGDVDGRDGVQCVTAAAKAVRADVVLVLGAERLYASIRSTFEHSPTATVLLTKSGGVVSRDDNVRMTQRSTLVRRYFYGIDNTLSPYTTVVELERVVVLKFGGVVAKVPDSVLPAGAQSSIDPLKPERILSMGDVLHSVLAVSQAREEADVSSVPVFGFVHVVKVDVDRDTMTVLAPSPGSIPGRFLLAGNMKWIE